MGRSCQRVPKIKTLSEISQFYFLSPVLPDGKSECQYKHNSYRAVLQFQNVQFTEVDPCIIAPDSVLKSLELDGLESSGDDL